MATALAWAPAAVLAQASDPVTTQPPAQAAELVARAKEAQEDFEDYRRDNLPRDTRWSRTECSAKVGRMCWRYLPDLQWRPPPESSELKNARHSLLLVLDSVAELIPEDPWILGQRVRYLLEGRRFAEGRDVARRCEGAPTWWCGALEGLALHLQGRYPEAERAFEGALEEMDPEEAGNWADPKPLVDPGTRSLLEAEPSSGPNVGAVLEKRFWALSDPLYLVPGNDRRSEHFARRTLDRLYSDAATPHRASWGRDLGELQIRYGQELGWERVPPRVGEYVPVAIVGYEHPDLRNFLPPIDVLQDPTEERPEGWAPLMWAEARSGYAPAYAPIFLPMASRIVKLTRGDRALVAATYQLPMDTTSRTREGTRAPHFPPPAFQGWPLRAGVVLQEPDGGQTHASVEDSEASGVLLLEVPAGDYIVSVEALDPFWGRAGRYRNGLRISRLPPDLPVLSELLLLNGDTLPENTVAALERLRVDDLVAVGEALVVAWELWGLGWQEEVVAYRLSLEPRKSGVLGRIGRLVSGTGRRPILEWEEPAPDEPGAAFQSVSVDLPALDPGEYELHLEVILQGRDPLRSSQAIRVEEPGGVPSGRHP